MGLGLLRRKSRQRTNRPCRVCFRFFHLVLNAGSVSGTGTQHTGNSQNEKILIAYFSWVSNTKGIAEEIQRQTGADQFKMTPVNPYSSDYNIVLDEAQRDQNAQACMSLQVI